MSDTEDREADSISGADTILLPSTSSSNDLGKMIRQARPFSGGERNCLFLNTRGFAPDQQSYAVISAISGFDLPDDGRALVHVDWDHDGDIDLWVSNRNAPRLRFFRNDCPPGNNWLQIRLRGSDASTNRDAIGARVKVVVTEDSGQSAELIKTRRSGEAFLAHCTEWMQFGLGQNGKIVKVVVQWPGAKNEVEEFSGFSENQRFELVQGTGTARVIPPRQDSSAIQASPTQVPTSVNVHRIPLYYRLPVNRLGYRDFDGRSHDYSPGKNNAVLVNLWSTTCQPCLKELGEFSERYDELQKAGIDILAVSVDEYENDDPNIRQKARELAKNLELPFTAGMVEPEVIAHLRQLHNFLIKMETALPMPSSFLIDRDGKLDVIYKGPVTVDTLLKDANQTELTMLERYQRGAALDGIVLQDDVLTFPMRTDEATAYLKLARNLIASGYLPEAEIQLQEVIKREPEVAAVQNDYALVSMLLGNTKKAEQHFNKAIEIEPENAKIRVNLGQALAQSNRLAEAKTQLEKAIDLDDQNADAFFNLGIVFDKSNQSSEAEENYRRAVQINPSHAQAYFTLGRLLERRRDFAGARTQYEKALEIEPNQPVILLFSGRMYLQEQDFVRAEERFRDSIANQPDYDDAYYHLGLALQGQNKPRLARQQFESAVQINPGHVGAQTELYKLSSQ